ncbi:MAG: hypothetical protein JF887_04385 [Candidatus Dormibacteraeota bacterium]|uniref:Uncharacterized protein n=1 Tax=Candidatus Amunia macphersoniae TaxID=3127014 RepID=A0A934KMT1_9BACT|nr:hypothetical protein [Candidatus Dormibacteraeota bacterium]
MTELIVRELRLRRFPAAAPAAAEPRPQDGSLRKTAPAPSPAEPAAARLAVRHSRRRDRPDREL